MTPAKSPLPLVLFLFAVLVGCAHPMSDPIGDPLVDRDASIEIAVVPFGLGAGTAPPRVDVASVIRRDLEAAGLSMTPHDALAERPVRLSEVQFERWRRAAVDYLVIGVVSGVHDGGHEVEFRLVDPRVEARERATLLGYVMASAPDALEATAHRIASMVGERLATDAATASVFAPAPGREGTTAPEVEAPSEPL